MSCSGYLAFLFYCMLFIFINLFFNNIALISDLNLAA